MVIHMIHDPMNLLVQDLARVDHTPDHMGEIIQLKKVITIPTKAAHDTKPRIGKFFLIIFCSVLKQCDSLLYFLRPTSNNAHIIRESLDDSMLLKY